MLGLFLRIGDEAPLVIIEFGANLFFGMVKSVKFDGFPELPPPTPTRDYVALAEFCCVTVRFFLRLFLTIIRSICSRCRCAFDFSVINDILSAFAVENCYCLAP